ncbi:MAG TPA: hypothetical protein VFO65_08195, partial [Acidimicrobiales bacterium]|nr:hypothetical protein [Acidimicrobiales bacterium]
AAHPVEVSLGARPVAIVPADAPARDQVVAALESSLLRPVDRAVGVLATVELSGGVRLLDAGGLPLDAAPRPMSEETLAALAVDLATLARATHLRELPSGTGGSALPDEVAITYRRLGADGQEVELARSGEHLFNGDRIVVRIRNDAAETRYVSVVDVGISGGVSLLTTSEPDGITLAAGEEYVLGATPTGAVTGIELYWPPSVPGGAPRPETVLAIVADQKITGLGRLEQRGVIAAKRDAGGPQSGLERLIGDLGTGRRDARPPAAEATATRYHVERLEFLLHEAARAGEADEPAFEIDERPDPSFRLVTPRSADAPGRVAVRLKELTVHSNRSILAAAVRIDALVVTAPPEGAGEPYRAATARFDRVKDGDRLPFDNLLVYEGPVGRFVDLAVWVSKDSRPDLDLADMLAAETGSADVKKALIALAGLALAAPQAAVVAGSAAAVAVLVRTAARVLDVVQGTGIGVYRTSLLPHERFGAGAAGQPGLHPPAGLLRAQDMSFAYEVVPLA